MLVKLEESVIVDLPYRTGPAVDIIVPVYRGMAETRNCIESIIASPIRTPYELVVINDDSPEAALVDWLVEKSRDKGLTLLTNEVNLGFVATANRGMALHPDRDVLLLNSDTAVANDWLDRIIAAAHKNDRIATVTPFSNNATICSYPKFLHANALPRAVDLATLDRLFSDYNSGTIVEIPTGVGFCLFIRRTCLNAIGFFDTEAFGKGYGEENDFCQRAANAGWLNVMAADVFVQHVGNVSFGAEHDARKLSALAVLRQRHPGYERKVSEYIANDPARIHRLQIDLARVRHARLRRILLVTHSQGGGTEQHCRELAERFADEAIFLALKPYKGGTTCLERYNHDETLKLYFELPEQTQLLLDLLRFCKLSFVHYHHLLGHDEGVWLIARNLDVPYYFSTHDYYPYCPRITLTGFDDRYCGEGGNSCEECCDSPRNHERSEIVTWRQRSRTLLDNAKVVIAPSRDAADRYCRQFPLANVVFAPHLDISGCEPAPKPIPPIAVETDLRIAVLGALSRSKGADLLEQTAAKCEERKLHLRFKLFGYPYRALSETPKLAIHGAYRPTELSALLSEWDPHVVWFPAQWPETYSYTLSTCLQLGLPVVVPDIGAFHDRIAGRPRSWVVRWQSTASEMAEFFDALRRGSPELPTIERVASCCPEFDYDRAYLGAPPMEIAPDGLPKGWEAACTPPRRFAAVPEGLKKVLRSCAHWVRYSPRGAQVVGLFPQAWREKVSLWLATDR